MPTNDGEASALKDTSDPILATPNRIATSPLGAYWQIDAGLYPGEAFPDYSRRFELSGEERRDIETFARVQADAYTYVMRLGLASMAGRGVNWSRIEFVWV